MDHYLAITPRGCNGLDRIGSFRLQRAAWRDYRDPDHLFPFVMASIKQ
jgi:hypothetical protein